MNCNYCSDSNFESEDDLYQHIRSEHDEEEVSQIDARKVRKQYGGFEGSPVGFMKKYGMLFAGAFVAAIVVGIVAYTVFMGGSNGENSSEQFSHVETTPSGTAHYHGQFYMSINGNNVDFSQQQYQLQDNSFHFESGEGVRWHGHANNITIQYALATLDIKLTEDYVTVNGDKYERGSEAEVSVTVNGSEVDPATYTLQRDDTVTVEINTNVEE